MTHSRMPSNLGTAGKRLWRAITAEYELAAHELAILESACREADLIARLEAAAKDAPLTVKGSMGQTVASPYVTELRQHRTTQANLLKSLRLPEHPSDEDEHEYIAPVRRMTRSEAGRKAALARWGRGA